VNFAELFELTVNPAELMLRGTAVYWFLFLIFRYVLRRDVGSVGVADILVLVLIADAAQNAMAGGYTSVTDGFILVGTIVGWNYALDWAAFHFEPIRHWAEPPPLPLVKDGNVLLRNMRREYITREELDAKLREAGVEDASEVKSACLETDGQISVIKKDAGGKDDVAKPQRKRGVGKA
jgi:uncharacterized membrane protein YcaP (DUF421 family)